MKILYVCHRFPFPPKRGGKIRPFNMIRHFARSHEVTVCSLVRSDAEAKEGEGLAAHCARYEMVRVHDPLQAVRMAARLPTPVPSSFGFFRSGELARRIRDAAARERFDLVFVHCSSVARYVEGIPDVPKILDFGDMDSQKWKEYSQAKPFPLSWGYGIEAWKLEREEARLARRFDLCTATTRAEWETLQAMETGTPSDWFPNGVDSEFFAPTDRPCDPDKIVFVGRMDYYPNQQCMFEFCAKVMPMLRARRPSTTLSIVGADPSPAVRELGKLPGVTVTGSVPDVRPYLHEAALMVAPLNIARGTQNKILEGMAAGVPVVSSRVAAGGVDATAPEHLLTATTSDEYVEAILRVLDDPAERIRLARAGRARMLSHHAWPQSMRRLDAIVERCLAQPRAERALAAAP
jgi:sugar transferase (PEP-CTERM/EpsH1 system associated)